MDTFDIFIHSDEFEFTEIPEDVWTEFFEN